MSLDGAVDAFDRRLGRRVPRHVRGLACAGRAGELVPASGSVIANATFVVPAAMPRSQPSFCSSVP
jgi:hypothetical protein